ncbi:MAG: RNA polymerase sigma factor [Planctomycetota bacterium]
MDPQQTASRFQTTSWTLIRRAGTSPEELEALLSRYWSPVYAYLRRTGQSPEDAADLTQGFLTKVIEDRKLITRADSGRGRFRSFLLVALNNFVADRVRAQRGRYGSRPKKFVPDDPRVLETVEPSEHDDPAKAFDRQWAATVFANILERLEADCRAQGLERHWKVFEARQVRPALHAVEPMPVEELVVTVGARDRDEIYSMQRSVKRKFEQTAYEVVGQTVDGPGEVAHELEDLRQFLVGT